MNEDQIRRAFEAGWQAAVVDAYRNGMAKDENKKAACEEYIEQLDAH
jgi:hypothetical protein